MCCKMFVYRQDNQVDNQKHHFIVFFQNSTEITCYGVHTVHVVNMMARYKFSTSFLNKPNFISYKALSYIATHN